MDIVNAIAKVRFSSARPQRVQLYKFAGLACELICLEPGQELSSEDKCAYYVIAGSGDVRAGKEGGPIAMGKLAACGNGGPHAVINSSEQRLICLAVTKQS